MGSDERQGGGALLHASVAVRSEARAEAVFGGWLGMPEQKRFVAGAELCEDLFGIAREATVIVYDAAPGAVEVFVAPWLAPRDGQLDHVCVAVADREAALVAAGALGFEVRRHRRDDKDVAFVRDLDGNLYEIK